MRPLTDKQKKVIAFLQAEYLKRGKTPSYRQIARHIGARSVNQGWPIPLRRWQQPARAGDEAMKAYHSDKALKTKCLRIMKKHRLSDRLVQGHGYWEDGKGCAVGCVLHDLAPGNESDHSKYETLIGVPQTLARLEDCIFEGLPKAKAVLWPERFLKAVKPGADLSGVWPKLALAILVDPQHGVILHAPKGSDTETCILKCAELYRRKIAGDEPSIEEWSASASAWAWASASASEIAGDEPSIEEWSASASAWASASASESAWASESASASAWAWASASESARARARARASHWEWIADTLILLIENTVSGHIKALENKGYLWRGDRELFITGKERL